MGAADGQVAVETRRWVLMEVAPVTETAKDPPLEYRLEVGERAGETTHGLLVMLVQRAREIGFFETLSSGLKLKLKEVAYSHRNKLETIVAGIAVGCRHTSEMQTKLVPDTTAAELFGMPRFPDQSQINTFLRRLTEVQVAHLAQAHQTLLEKQSLCADRERWLRLSDGRQVLPVDLDQTPIVTRSTRAKGATSGYFGRKRGNRGYKKSLALLGGGVREVLCLQLEPGNTHAQEAVPTVLASLMRLAKAKRIAPSKFLVRADSQYGSIKVVRLFRASRVHYLVKGYTPNASKRLADDLPETAVWYDQGLDSNGSRVWVADAGVQSLHAEEDRADTPPLKTRVVVAVRVAFRERKKHGRGAPNQVAEKSITYEHYLTDLPARALPVAPFQGSARSMAAAKGPTLLGVYNARETEERFFHSEQDALGVHYLRTYNDTGEAAFLWLAASTVNLLRWTQVSQLAGTQLEEVGLTKLVTQVMQIPATITRTTKAWVITMPVVLRLARHLASSFLQREQQLPLPGFALNTS